MIPLVNKTYLTDMAGSDQEMFLGIVDEFKTNSTHILTQLQDALEQGKTEAVPRLAHQLKGSSGMLGMEQLFEHCKKIETIDPAKIDSEFLSELNTCLNDSVTLALEILGRKS